MNLSQASLRPEPDEGYPRFRERIPDLDVVQGRYALRFARTPAELDAVLRLRFEVFNLELGEGLADSWRSRRDRDAFDALCHHLYVEDRSDGAIIGTYRLQTSEMAAAGAGFYAASEFALDGLPEALRGDSVELGRACIARAHRSSRALLLLWRGLAAYLRWNRKRFLFGCCSLTSQSPAEGWAVHDELRARCALHASLSVAPLPALACARGEALPSLPEG
ncbi:MAG: GNAT family N-acetyltransferase, partial [Solirubrobacteraceae bacterium]